MTSSVSHHRAVHACLLALTSTAICSWSWRTNGAISWREGATLLLLAGLTWVHGQWLCAALGLDKAFERAFSLVFLTGAVALGLGLALLAIFAPVSLPAAVGLHVCGAAFGNAWAWRRLGTWTLPRRAVRWDLLGSASSVIAASLLLGHLAPQQVERDGHIALRVFLEYYSNAVNALPLLSDPPAMAHGSWQFCGEPLSFYHFACYSYAAVLRSLGGQPMYLTMASLWLPMCWLQLGLAALCLGRTVFGRRAAVWCALAVVAVPDATFWSAHVVPYSFDRVIEASCGMAYAVAGAALGLVMIYRGQRRRRGVLVAEGIVLVFLSAYFKVNIVVGAPPAALALVWSSRRRRTPERARWASAAILLLVLLGYLAGSRLRSAPTFTLDPALGREMAKFARDYVDNRGWLAWLHTRSLDPWPGASVARAIFFAVVMYQGGIVVLAASAALARLAAGKRWQSLRARVAWWPAAIVAWSVALQMFIAPNRNGDPSELQHRIFVWHYLLLAVWAAGTLWFALRGWWGERLRGGGTLVACAWLMPLVLGRTMWIPHDNVIVDAGYVRTLDYLRTKTDRRDCFVDLERDPWLIATAMAERRAFVCRDPAYNFPGQNRLREVRRFRWDETTRLADCDSRQAIAAWAAEHRVRWCLKASHRRTRWPADVLANAAFESGGHAVYDLFSIADRRDARSAP